MIKNVNEPTTAPSPTASRTAGSQTLARGLEVLRLVAGTPAGLSINEVAEHAGIHRTGAYRLLNTLCDAQLLHRGADSRYRGAAGLLTLSASAYHSLLAAAEPVLRRYADELGATLALIVREGAEAIALRVTAPTSGTYHVSFAEASRHPLDLGAAGHAILASEPENIGEDPRVTAARTHGYAQTFGEVEPGMHGLAVPLARDICGVPACLNLITVRQDQATSAVAVLQQAARALEGSLT
ncbi:IclR family transcriptional regulator [Paeniglutamicibacter gangotriensis Lz1y]|uniref:IclR family transcriptional regulator n=1 Tax=Paeniglutamicibacter gangotriensis Lz1y TaxID=1276920 RepID=M7NJH3_9MICC|nr:IclR family transcriptional regulator [Paeniglutamicibacter gangotriensis Lz1y]